MPRTTEWTECTARRTDGAFCSRQTLPDAPFPICLKHASEVYGYIRGRLAVVAGTKETMLEATAGLLDSAATGRAERAEFKPDRIGRVYYVQVGHLVKIGFTERLATRMNAYPPTSRLLASEPGDADLEAARLGQFRHLLSERREWFRTGSDLLDHINRCRRRLGQKPTEFDMVQGL
jgi:hypothetical protein